MVQRAATILFALLLAALATAADAPTIKVQALLNGKAVMQIGDEPAVLMKVGESRQGVKLLAADTNTALLLVNGVKQKLALTVGAGLQPSVVSSQVIRPYLPPTPEPSESTGKLELPADAGGHFHLTAMVNGKRIPFVVDTGATYVVLTEAQAKLAGYKLDDGRPVRALTANGETINYQIVLRSVQIGSMTFARVNAVIAPTLEGGEGLMGMSVLRQMQFRQQGNTLKLSALPPVSAGKSAAVENGSEP